MAFGANRGPISGFSGAVLQGYAGAAGHKTMRR